MTNEEKLFIDKKGNIYNDAGRYIGRQFKITDCFFDLSLLETNKEQFETKDKTP